MDWHALKPLPPEPFLLLRFYRIYLFSGNPKKQLLDECDYYLSVCSGSFFDIFPVCFSPSLLYSGHPNTQKRGNQVSQLFVFSLLYRTFFLYLLFSANHFFPWNSSFGSAFNFEQNTEDTYRHGNLKEDLIERGLSYIDQ